MPIRKSILANILFGSTANRPVDVEYGTTYDNYTLGIEEIYTPNGWFPKYTLAAATPTSVVATNQGTGRAFNNGQASVAFSPNTAGGVPTSFTVTSTPGSYTATGTSSPITITGLQSNTAYTYTVTSTNNYGTSSASSASSGVTASTVPATPSAPTVTNTVAAYGATPSQVVSWSAPATGGSAITSYTITPSSGSAVTGITGTSTTINTTAGTAYTYTVTAVNANGSSTASAASSSVTAGTVPQAPTIGTATSTGTTTATLTFTAPANNGGSTITSYTATSSPGGITSTLNQAGSGTFNITGLTGSTNYTFTVTATNAIGTSAASSSSNQITTATPAPSSPVSGYYMWFDANDASTITSNSGYVSQWNDKSGNNLHVTNVSGDNNGRPRTGVSTMNGKNVLTWDNASVLKGLVTNTPSPLSGNPNVTIFIVANYKTGANYYGASTALAIGNDQASPDGSTVYSPGFIVNPGWGTVGSGWLGASPNRTVSINQDLRNTTRCYIIDKNSSNVTTAYFNKTSQGSVSGSWNVFTTGSGFSKFAIGYSPQNGTTGNYTFFGDIAEVLIYTSSLTTEQRELNVDYLTAKWGI